MGVVHSQTFRHPQLGVTHVRVVATARRFTARIKAGEVYLSCPPVSAEEVMHALETMAPQLLPKLQQHTHIYHEGYRYDGPGWSISIETRAILPHGRLKIERQPDHARTGLRHYTIFIYEGADFAAKNVEKCIASCILDIAAEVAAGTVLPLAHEVALSTGLATRVRGWKIGRGRRRLGCCSADGHISLSAVLAFMPRELQLHTITHELAHLDHFDHSPAFHARWQQLFGGPTAPGSAALAKIKYPLP